MVYISSAFELVQDNGTYQLRLAVLCHHPLRSVLHQAQVKMLKFQRYQNPIPSNLK